MFMNVELQQMTQNNVGFQQDGTTAHTETQTMDILRCMLPHRLISRFGDIGRPAISPDFFFWGYLKFRVYHLHLQTIQELKNVIRE